MRAKDKLRVIRQLMANENGRSDAATILYAIDDLIDGRSFNYSLTAQTDANKMLKLAIDGHGKGTPE